jgi:hypothetical protein
MVEALNLVRDMVPLCVRGWLPHNVIETDGAVPLGSIPLDVATSTT